MSAMLDLTDPQIQIAYKAITHGGDTNFNWLLLSYSDTPHVVKLYATGMRGFNEMRDYIQAKYIFFGFCRERVHGIEHYVMINYVPESVTEVERARTFVHSRSIGLMFNLPKTSLTIGRKEDLQLSTIQHAIADSSWQQGSPPALANSSGHASSATAFLSRRLRSPSTDATESTIFGLGIKLSRRHRSSGSKDSSSEEVAPPPPPPKDAHFAVSAPLEEIHERSYTMCDDRIIVLPDSSPDASPKEASTILSHTRTPTRSRPPVPRVQPNPEEQARRRAEARERRAVEEQAALEAENSRQLAAQREREEQEEQDAEEERRRREHMDQEIRYAALERAKREEREQKEDEARSRMLQERKRAARARRMTETQRLEDWREEQRRGAEEAARMRDEARLIADTAKRERLARVDLDKTEGWVTVQADGEIAWRRRYYQVQLQQGVLTLFKSDEEKDRENPATILRLSSVQCVVEWTENDRDGDKAYLQELAAIPNSFALDFRDSATNAGLWMMFTDSQAEKDHLMGLLARAARL